MTKPSILVAGIGNIFFGDDGFGVEVVRRLATRQLPAEVRVVDFGIRGLDLAYALLDPYELVILVDAAQAGAPPGTLQVLQPHIDDLPLSAESASPQTHGMVPTKALEMAKSMGAEIKQLRLVSCEPACFDDFEEGHCGLSEPVANAVDRAVALIDSLIDEFLVCTNSE